MSWKDRFDLGDTVYLNGANHGPFPRVACAAVEEALAWKRDPARIDDAIYFTLPDRVRRAAAPFFGCRPQDLAVCTGASSGVALLAGGLDWRAGDRVIIPAGEFPTNYLPWRALQERGVTVDVLPTDRGLCVDQVADALLPSTRVVAVGHVNFATGYRVDIEAIGRLCSERGVAFLIDASQSACAVPLDAPAAHATVVAAAGYKWMLSPYGTGLLYVDPEWVDRLPVMAVNWTSVVGAEDFNNLTALQLDYRPGAVRWDAPETASFLNLMPMAASLEFLGAIGIEGVLAHATALVDRLVDGLPAGFRADSSLQSAQRSTIFRVIGDDPRRTRTAYERALAAGISVSMRESGIRVSPGVWNAVDDIDRLLTVLGDSATA
ncbi:MAG: aminotransferase class V-fold PLP-dependent enzyme [Acidobacteriota bacterium]